MSLDTPAKLKLHTYMLFSLCPIPPSLPLFRAFSLAFSLSLFWTRSLFLFLSLAGGKGRMAARAAAVVGECLFSLLQCATGAYSQS